MRGRKRKPTALKILTGNPGKRALNDREPIPQAIPPTPPAWLAKEALVEWDRLVAELAALGIITRLDMAILAGYCQAWARVVKLEATVAKKGGAVIVSPTGGPYPSPWQAALNKAYELVHKFGSELGLTPSARARLQTGGGGQPQDPFEKYLNARA